jgi:ribosomal protein L31
MLHENVHTQICHEHHTVYLGRLRGSDVGFDGHVKFRQKIQVEKKQYDLF